MKILLDQSTLKKQTMITDDDGFTIRTDWDETPFLNHMQRMRQHNTQESSLGRYVGSVPMELLGQWLKEDPELLDKQGAIVRKLRDNEFAKLRAVDRSKI
jgi:hypothetical protein